MNYSSNFEDIYLYNIYSIMNNISLDLIFYITSENINIMILLIFDKFKSILLFFEKHINYLLKRIYLIFILFSVN